MTKYAAEDIHAVYVRRDGGLYGLFEDREDRPGNYLSPAQCAAVAVALERPEEVLRLIRLKDLASTLHETQD